MGIELWWLLPDAGPSDIPYYGQTFHGINPTYNPNTNWDVVPATSLFATVPALAGDYNQNGIVDAADYVVWRDTYSGPNVPPVSLAADGDGDGDVDANDHAVWQAHFGQMTPPPGPDAGSASDAIPEPASLVLIILAAADAVLARHTARPIGRPPTSWRTLP